MLLAGVSPILGGEDGKEEVGEEPNKELDAFLLLNGDEVDEDKIEVEGVFSSTFGDGFGCVPNSGFEIADVAAVLSLNNPGAIDEVCSAVLNREGFCDAGKPDATGSSEVLMLPRILPKADGKGFCMTLDALDTAEKRLGHSTFLTLSKTDALPDDSDGGNVWGVAGSENFGVVV
jgi:hypothetical protein